MVKLISDSNKRPGCQLFEGDLCLDPEDEAVVSHLIHEEDLKRNVIRNRKKLWPQKTVYYSVDRNLSELFWKFVRYVGRKVIFFWRYWTVFMRYFGNFNHEMRYCGIF